LDAVKVLDWGNDGQDTTTKHREAFQKEVAVWQKLDHPNVTKVCIYAESTILFIASSIVHILLRS
jgi:hypothetical protein